MASVVATSGAAAGGGNVFVAMRVYIQIASRASVNRFALESQMKPAVIFGVIVCLNASPVVADVEEHEAAESTSSHENSGASSGEYPMNREGSGKSWQPQATPMGGFHI